MSTDPDVRHMVETLVRAVVDEEDRVQVLECRGMRSSLLEVHTSARDVGRLLGRNGCLADAIRVLLRGIGGKNNHNYHIDMPG